MKKHIHKSPKHNKTNKIEETSSQSQEIANEIKVEEDEMKVDKEMKEIQEIIELFKQENTDDTYERNDSMEEVKEIEVDVLSEWTDNEISTFLRIIKESEMKTPDKDLRMVFVKINMKLLQKKITHIWVFYQFYRH